MQLNFGEIFYVFFLGLILYFVLKKQLFEPIGRILDKREEIIEGTKEFISKANAEIEEKDEKWNTSINEASLKAYDIMEHGRSEGFEKRKEIITEAQQGAYNMLNSARDEIRQYAGKMEESLKTDVDDFTSDIIKLLLGRKIKV